MIALLKVVGLAVVIAICLAYLVHHLVIHRKNSLIHSGFGLGQLLRHCLNLKRLHGLPTLGYHGIRMDGLTPLRAVKRQGNVVRAAVRSLRGATNLHHDAAAAIDPKLPKELGIPEPTAPDAPNAPKPPADKRKRR